MRVLSSCLSGRTQIAHLGRASVFGFIGAAVGAGVGAGVGWWTLRLVLVLRGHGVQVSKQGSIQMNGDGGKQSASHRK